MEVTLYNIPQLSAHKPISLTFISKSARDDYFNTFPNKTIPNYVGNDWGERYNLYNEITVNYIDIAVNPYNYVKLKEDSTQEHFYYIIGYEQISVTSMALKLKKDTFMTYMSAPNTGVYLGSRPSLVVREHKPRFDYTLGTVLIDEFLENNNNTMPKLLDEGQLLGTTRMRFVYRNRSSDWKPVAYVYSVGAQTVSFIGDDWVANLTPGDVGENLYCFTGDYQYTFGSGTPNITVTDNWTLYYHVLMIRGLGEQWRVERYEKSTGLPMDVSVVTVPSGGSFKIKMPTTNIGQIYYCPRNLTWSTIQANYQALNNAPSGTAVLPQFDQIDIYDVNNERIVEIPYFDSSMTFRKDGQGIYVTLDQIVKYQGVTQMLIKIGTGTTIFDTSKTDKNRVKYNEPKLYSSQFSPRFITMNGMTQGFKLEWLNKGFGLTGPNLEVKPYFETSALSPSLYNMRLDFGTGIIPVKSQIDEFIKRWTVNNEVAVVKDDAYTFNEYYRDLDDKSRKIAEDASLRNAAFNIANQGLNVVGGAFKPDNSTQIATRGVSSVINMADTVLQHQDYMQQNMIKYNQKYISLQLSMSQISGSTLDFLKTFNGDKFRYHIYGLRDRDLEYWDEIFFKYGYQTLEYKIPNLRTRRYFDYKQIIIDEYDQGYGIDEESYEDLRVRLANGLTLFHHDASRTLQIDWNQTKENWEV